MISQEKQEKIKTFFNNLSNIQPDHGRDIGLIVLGDETLGDLKTLTPNSNLVTIFDLTSDVYITGFLEDLAKNLSEERIVFVRIHKYLDPAVYNQLYLISKSGRMDMLGSEKDSLINVSDKAMLILVFTDNELESLNYKNILNIVGPVLRLN